MGRPWVDADVASGEMTIGKPSSTPRSRTNRENVLRVATARQYDQRVIERMELRTPPVRVAPFFRSPMRNGWLVSSRVPWHQFLPEASSGSASREFDKPFPIGATLSVAQFPPAELPTARIGDFHLADVSALPSPAGTAPAWLAFVITTPPHR